MVYKRRPTSRESNNIVPTETPLPTYLDIHAVSDYEPIGRLGTAWIGLHRLGSTRQVVMVDRVYQTNLADFERIARIVHHNIAPPKALYCVSAELYVVHEYVEFDIFDLVPMSHMEVATVMSQAMKAIHYLIEQNVGFRIGAIRISMTGRVKLVLDWVVLDWNFEATTDFVFLRANVAYLAVQLEEIMAVLDPLCATNARSFVDDLKTGSLPYTFYIPDTCIENPLLEQSGDPSLLEDACRFALQKKLAADRQP